MAGGKGPKAPPWFSGGDRVWGEALEAARCWSVAERSGRLPLLAACASALPACWFVVAGFVDPSFSTLSWSALLPFMSPAAAWPLARLAEAEALRRSKACAEAWEAQAQAAGASKEALWEIRRTVLHGAAVGSATKSKRFGFGHRGVSDAVDFGRSREGSVEALAVRLMGTGFARDPSEGSASSRWAFMICAKLGAWADAAEGRPESAMSEAEARALAARVFPAEAAAREAEEILAATGGPRAKGPVSRL